MSKQKQKQAPRPIPFLASIAMPVALAMLAGCGPDTGTTTPGREHASDTQAEAVATLGDARVRASVVPTTRLHPAVASQYGIVPAPGTVLLLVGVRTGLEADETALPADVSAAATDLRGVRQEIALHEVRSGDLIDYAGVAKVSPPDSLRFDVTVTGGDGASTTLKFSRDIFPE